MVHAIERDLTAADPRLAAMFQMFNDVNWAEGLAMIEPVGNGPARGAWRRVRAFLAAVFLPSSPEPVGTGPPRLGPPGSR